MWLRIVTSIAGATRDSAVPGFDADRAGAHAHARQARARILELAETALRAQGDAPAISWTTEIWRQASRTPDAEVRHTVERHAQIMRDLGYPREQVISIATELADRAAREVTVEMGRGIWPCGSELRDEFLRWTADAYDAADWSG
jgi:hypothetical protein